MFIIGQQRHSLMKHRLQYQIPIVATENTHKSSLQLLNEATFVSSPTWKSSTGLKQDILDWENVLSSLIHTAIDCKPIIMLTTLGLWDSGEVVVSVGPGTLNVWECHIFSLWSGRYNGIFLVGLRPIGYWGLGLACVKKDSACINCFHFIGPLPNTAPQSGLKALGDLAKGYEEKKILIKHSAGLRMLLVIDRCLITSSSEILEMQRLPSNTKTHLVDYWIIRACYTSQRYRHVQLLLKRNCGSQTQWDFIQP